MPNNLLQLNPPLPLTTPKGPGLAHLVIDYGPEHNILWTVIINEGPHAGEIYTYGNPQVRGDKNITFGREIISHVSVGNEDQTRNQA